MVSRVLPNLGLEAFFALGEDGWKDEADLNFLKLSVLSQAGAISKVAATPAMPAAGDVHIFGATHPTQPNRVAVFDDGVWKYFTPLEGWQVYNRGTDAFELFDGTVWNSVVAGSGIPDAPADGDLYARRDNAWEVFTPGGGGGGSSSWSTLLSWNHAVDGNLAAPVITGITGNEILILFDECQIQQPVGTPLVTTLAALLSTDGGATYHQSPISDHRYPNVNNVTVGDDYIRATTVTSSAARSSMFHILNAQSAVAKMGFTNGDPFFIRSLTGAVNAIRLQNRGVTPGTFTAGRLTVLHR